MTEMAAIRMAIVVRMVLIALIVLWFFGDCPKIQKKMERFFADAQKDITLRMTYCHPER